MAIHTLNIAIHSKYSIPAIWSCAIVPDMATHNLPPADPRSPVETVFFDVVDQANAIFHLLEKHFTDAIIRLVGSTPVYAECVRKKKEGMEMMETKLDSGLDRVLTSLVGWIRYILNTEQKKTDFKPEYTPDDNWTGLDLFSCTSVIYLFFNNAKSFTIRQSSNS
ncbi:predicted protein [Nematostella vectensis]|uniref:Exocyst complex component Sec10-like alpha-helical bundle domain-containing protein n=1 Tax=Nematostella vectensis TaxID=45351 RepID=A8DVC6_NEMVE|nr:predicted protein [Nematostella vectensis]|eukprot:XP_001617934.1 hypothetical protein NEMVEDRAFT_v1g225654 [Nematostella vectensis]